MKTVTVNGRTLQYETEWISCGEDVGSDPVTNFYEGTETVSWKKYLLFGERLTKEVPRKVFSIYADSESENLSKTWWKTQIADKLALLNRKEELERGELC